MATPKVSDLVGSARALFNDKYSDHFVQDDLTAQINSVNTRLRLTNRNIVLVADGAPTNLTVYVNGVATAYASIDKVSGVVVMNSAPTTGSLVLVEYYFVLIADADYIDFAKDASRFVGTTPTFTALTDNSGVADLLVDACDHYIVHHCATKMSSLTSWYYQANAGNKSFNKDRLADKFSKTADEEMKTAVQLRDDVYKRQGQREAPAMVQSTIVPLGPFTPPR
jgi:hypothetical protein